MDFDRYVAYDNDFDMTDESNDRDYYLETEEIEDSSSELYSTNNNSINCKIQTIQILHKICPSEYLGVQEGSCLYLAYPPFTPYHGGRERRRRRRKTVPFK